MAEFPPSELPPEQPGEPDRPLDMEIASRDPQTDELDRPGVAERLAWEKEFQAGVTEFAESDLMSDEDKIRLLMQGGEAMGRLGGSLKQVDQMNRKCYTPKHGARQSDRKISADAAAAQ